MCALTACRPREPFANIPRGQEAAVARIAAHAPTMAPPREGGFLDPPETGRQVRAQAVRRPPPLTGTAPPPGG